jgi:hypothetical protein
LTVGLFHAILALDFLLALAASLRRHCGLRHFYFLGGAGRLFIRKPPLDTLGSPRDRIRTNFHGTWERSFFDPPVQCHAIADDAESYQVLVAIKKQRSFSDCLVHALTVAQGMDMQLSSRPGFLGQDAPSNSPDMTLGEIFAARQTANNGAVARPALFHR